MEIFLLIVFLIVIWIVHDLSYPPEDYPKQPKVDPFYKIEPTVQLNNEKHTDLEAFQPTREVAAWQDTIKFVPNKGKNSAHFSPKPLKNKEPTTVTDPNKLVIAAEDDAFRR